jgi:sugar lactone lactonase YvrE
LVNRLAPLAVAASLTGCPALFPPPGEEPTPAPECPGITPGKVTPLATIAGGTEGVAFRGDGALFVSGRDGTIWQIDPAGQATAFAQVPEPLGMAAFGDGLAVATWDDGAGSGQGAVVYVGSDGRVEPMALGMPTPNALAVTPWGTLLVSDDLADTIVELDGSGLARPWLDTIPSPNGLVVAQDGSGLWVASTFTNPPPLTWVPFAGQVAGEPVPVWEFPTASAPDGVAQDADGAIYVALNLTGEIARYTDADGATIFASGLENPASLAFGLGGGWDPCRAVVTSLTGDSVVLVDVGVPGGVFWY